MQHYNHGLRDQVAPRLTLHSHVLWYGDSNADEKISNAKPWSSKLQEKDAVWIFVKNVVPVQRVSPVCVGVQMTLQCQCVIVFRCMH